MISGRSFTEITLDSGVVGNSYICPYLVNYTQPIEFVIRELFGLIKNKPRARRFL